MRSFDDDSFDHTRNALLGALTIQSINVPTQYSNTRIAVRCVVLTALCRCFVLATLCRFIVLNNRRSCILSRIRRTRLLTRTAMRLPIRKNVTNILNERRAAGLKVKCSPLSTCARSELTVSQARRCT